MIDTSSLNERQKEAVLHGDGPLLVLAGAGSGKTRVITYRIAHLIDSERARPGEIAAVTFTNKAAAEMYRRISSLLGSSVHGRPTIATFHSLSLRVLREFADRIGYTKSFAVYDSPDQLALIKRVQRKLEMDETAFPPRRLRNAISDAKGKLISVDEFTASNTDFYGSRLARVYGEYQKTLRELDGMDFDDLIVNHVRLLRENEDVRAHLHERWKYLLIDEYQDTNHMQYVLVRELAGQRQNVTAVGDEDQSIYKFRGADIDNILNFERDFEGAEVIKLEQNYRSTGNILAAASAVVSHNVRRKGKTLFTDAAAGDPVRVVAHPRDRDEAEFVISNVRELRETVPLNEIAILFRTNAQSRSFEEELRSANIPYVVVGGTKFYERAEIKDALAFARAAIRHQDAHSIERVINVPARGIGAATIERLRAAAEQTGGTLWDSIVAPPEDLGTRARKAVAEFRAILVDLAKAAEESNVPEFFETLLQRTGYRQLYVNSRDPQDDARIENLDELVSSTKEFQEENPDATVRDYLDAISLIADVDEWDDKSGSLTLMTLHSAKGLEFRVVFLTGLEDGLLPHVQSSDDVEEERRLCYVGMTRAREQLYLTHAGERRVHGTFRQQEESPFLLEIPDDCLERSGTLSHGHGGARSRFEPVRERREASGTASSIGSFFNAPVRFDSSALRTKTARDGGADDKLERGARVRHEQFGDGVILQKEGSGDATRLTVYFDRVGRKKFVARFANLTKI
ncbi:MAG: UvrD-helicase domain-containing protein [Acidobacteria bacterium]|nr:UvrD-helicase domain-containing protein [Acidobacteriota bacterium]